MGAVPPLPENMGNMVLNRTEVLTAATEAVQLRNERYGEPRDNFERIAVLWSAYAIIRPNRTAQLTGADVAIMMALLKIARLANDPTHTDSWVDLCGYGACGAECAGD